LLSFQSFAARRRVTIVRIDPETLSVNGDLLKAWNVGDDAYRRISPLGLASSRVYSLAELVCEEIGNDALLRKWKKYEAYRRYRDKQNKAKRKSLRRSNRVKESRAK